MKDLKKATKTPMDLRIFSFMLLGAFIIAIYGAHAYYGFGRPYTLPILGGVLFLVLFAIIDYSIRRNTFRASLLSIIACVFGLVGIEIDGGITPFALGWSMIIPPMAFYCLGQRGGYALSGLFLGATGMVAALQGLKIVSTPHPASMLMELMLVFAFDTALIAVYEHAVRFHRRELLRSATHDRLTGLPNRESLKADIALTAKKTLFIASLDDLDALAEIYGENAQRTIVLESAKRLGSYSESADGIELYHIQTQEFALLYPGELEPQEAETIASEICDALGASVVTGTAALWVTVTVGAALDSRRPFADCDAALKIARDTCVPFAILGGSLRKRTYPGHYVEALAGIRKGLQEDRFAPYFQPILDNRTSRVTKYECLARLETPEGMSGPADFMEAARKAKLYPEITRTMVRKSFAYFCRESGDFSINLRLDDMVNPQTTKYILDMLDAYGIGDRVIFELLETDRIEQLPEVTAFIDEARRYGCRFAIDDFGSGYSNFDFTIRIKADFIKIDASLISRLSSDPAARVAVRAIVSFAKALGVATVAEFVYDGETQERVRELGIDCSQGYFIGKPASGPEVSRSRHAQETLV